MSYLPTPNFVLTEDYTHTAGLFKQKTLTSGAFVRPIDIRYVPAHVTDGEDGKWFNPAREVYCYTKWGIIPIPKHILRRV